MSRDPIDDPTFAITPTGTEPEDPGAMQMSSSFGQGSAITPHPNMMTIQLVSHDPMVQAQLTNAMQSAPAQTNGLPQVNPYAYVANNPINHRDPSGLLMSPPQPAKPGKSCPIQNNDLYNQCVANCKRENAGNAAAIANCIWVVCKQYLGH